jgi:hypothetical protein
MSVRVRSVRLGAVAIVAFVVSIAGCSDGTAPQTTSSVAGAITGRGPQRVLVPEDTLACHSGWIIAEGRYRCT